MDGGQYIPSEWIECHSKASVVVLTCLTGRHRSAVVHLGCHQMGLNFPHCPFKPKHHNLSWHINAMKTVSTILLVRQRMLLDHSERKPLQTALLLMDCMCDARDGEQQRRCKRKKIEKIHNDRRSGVTDWLQKTSLRCTLCRLIASISLPSARWII